MITKLVFGYLIVFAIFYVTANAAMGKPMQHKKCLKIVLQAKISKQIKCVL